MTDQNDMNWNNELNEQDLEQTAGGLPYFMRGLLTAKYRCPECGAKKKLAVRDDHLARCDKCKVPMEFIGYVDK